MHTMDKENSATSTRNIGDEKSKLNFCTSMTLRGLSNTRPVQNFHVIWLDEDFDEINNEECRNQITKIRQIVNTVHTFTNVDKCIDFINDMKKEKAFIIISDAFSQTTIHLVHDLSQVSVIYIFCESMDRHQEWTKQWFKVKGVLTDITSICEALKQSAINCDRNSASLSTIPINDGTYNQSLDQLDKSFMYTQILKEIILSMDFNRTCVASFLNYCRVLFPDNILLLESVVKLEKEYYDHHSIWWYTYEYLLYSMLNRALRTMDIDTIIAMSFFIRDLHQQIVKLHSEQFTGHSHFDSFTVFRGQGLSQTDFNQLMKAKGGLLSFNSFLSTSYDRQVSFTFAVSNQENPDLIGVLFKIDIDPSIESTPYANIRNFSHYQTEEEILFSMHSVFRIQQIQQIDGNNRLWEVSLTLTNDNDLQLQSLTEHIREETYPTEKGWHRLATLLTKLGQFDEAQVICDVLLNQTLDEHDKGFVYHMIGMINNHQGKYSTSLSFYEKALQIREKSLSPNLTYVGNGYNDIGTTYFHMGEYEKALPYYEKALEIRLKSLPENHPYLGHSYNNIAVLYKVIGNHSKAFSFYEKALEINHKSLPDNHPTLIAMYINMGTILNQMGQNAKALSFLEKALAICEKTQPSNHPDFVNCYNSLGLLYSKVGDCSKALLFCNKALDTCIKALPLNHPHLANTYKNIGIIYYKTGKYLQALPYYRKALEIYQETGSSNASSLSNIFNNMGHMYFKMHDYSNALLNYEKALENFVKYLPSHHDTLKWNYTNVGLTYEKMGEYSKALSYHEKALEIIEKSHPSNDLDLAIKYKYIGSLYDKINDHVKARQFNEKASQINQNKSSTQSTQSK